MGNRLSLLIFVFALIVAVVGSGCADLGQCRLGALGCECQAGSCSEGTCQGGMCVPCRPGDPGCVDLCTAPVPFPGSEPSYDPIDCTFSDFAEACVQLCRAYCRRADWFCGEDCGMGDCLGVDAQSWCSAPTLCGNDVTCLQDLCAFDQAQNCDGWLVGVGCVAATPDCANIVCESRCDNTAFNDDGDCDDGGLANGDFALCPIGGNCNDCGPRTLAETQCLPLGSACISLGLVSGDFIDNCCGSGIGGSAACVEVDAGSGLSRCVARCSGPTDTCGGGAQCSALPAGHPSGTGFACFPDCS